MICLVHGYGLSASGSNLWTRAITEALCYKGHDVHLVCQESKPAALDFVAEAFAYDADGTPEQLFSRGTSYRGRCTLHRPSVDVLPTYVRPPEGSTTMVHIPEMSDAAIGEYLQRNEAALRLVLQAYDITAMHVNHVVLMAVAVQRVCAAFGRPFAILPHGSAIEYVVRKDPRMQQLASKALEACDRIFVLSDEIRTRIGEVFPALTDVEAKMRPLQVGVNTRQFRLVERAERPESIARLKEKVRGLERGKTPEHTHAMTERLQSDLSLQEVQPLLAESADYPSRRPDADLEAKLDRIDWASDEILAFIGRLIGHKGVHSVVTAFPAILAERSHARLLLAGSGPLREPLEAFVWALAHGRRRLAENIVRWGHALEGEEAKPFATVAQLFERLREEERLEAYFQKAEAHLSPERVVFTGYLEHEALCHLYPCCDVVIFPSIVPEAGPMVATEAMASGAYPMGADHTGIRQKLGVAASALPPEDARHMRLSPDPARTVFDIIEKAPEALALRGKHRAALRRAAEKHFAWRSIAETLARELTALTRERA